MSLTLTTRTTLRSLVVLAFAAAATACGGSKDVVDVVPPPPPPPPPPAPVIALAPATVTINDTIGGAVAAPITVNITNSGTGTLGGLALDTVTFGTGGTGWVSAAISGADAPATITLTVKDSALAAGTYTATLPVKGTNATTQPLTITLNRAGRAAPPPVSGPVILAAGNLAHCAPAVGQGTATSHTIATQDSSAVFIALGDMVYPQAGGSGPTTLADFNNCYAPLFGQFKARTYAVSGNMEQDSLSLAAGADAYFGASRFGPPNKNYYSFNLGTWHVIVLNVIGGVRNGASYGNNSTQLNWLTADLAANASKKCVLAIWHDPMWYSSNTAGQTGIENSRQSGVWRELYNAHADVVINGGDHSYERMAPMYYNQADSTKFVADSLGLRQFNSGLGGDGSAAATVSNLHPLSQYRQGGQGVLKMTLGDGEYAWAFLNNDGTTSDAGRATCH